MLWLSHTRAQRVSLAFPRQESFAKGVLYMRDSTIPINLHPNNTENKKHLLNTRNCGSITRPIWFIWHRDSS